MTRRMLTEATPTWQDFIDGWEIFREPIICAAIAGAVLGFLSIYVVMRRMVFVSAAITQSAGLGVALSFWLEIVAERHIDPIIGAALLALGTTLVLLLNPDRLGLTREAVLGVVFALSGGAAVWLGARISQEAHDIQAILFGTAVLVRSFDLHVIAVCAAVLMAIHVWLFRALTFTSFDPTAAKVQGLPVVLLQGFVLLSIGLMVGVSARALGAMPVFAMSTLPAMVTLTLRLNFRTAFVVATAVGAVSGVGGYVLSFFTDSPVGASQTLFAVLLIVLTTALGAFRKRLRV